MAWPWPPSGGSPPRAPTCRPPGSAIAAGTATSIDELSARALEAQRRSELALASNERDRLRKELGGLLGLDGPVRIVLPEEPEDGVAVVPPELVAARERYDASRAKTAAGGRRYAPWCISVFGTAQASTVEFATGRDTRWTVGLDATLPLFDGGLREGRLDQARAERDEAEAALRSQEDAVERALRNAERELQTAHERLVLASEQAALAVEASDVAARGLAAGAHESPAGAGRRDRCICGPGLRRRRPGPAARRRGGAPPREGPGLEAVVRFRTMSDGFPDLESLQRDTMAGLLEKIVVGRTRSWGRCWRSGS